jgi:hypothetical protein
MMNYEQFYYWLDGYMEIANEIDCQLNRIAIQEVMKTVIQPKVLNTTPFTSQISTGIVPLNCK